MKMTINSATQFADQFRDYGRGDNFSYDALHALYEWYEELDPDMELDVIAICCDWYEYESITEAYRDFFSDQSTDEDDMRDELSDRYTCIFLDSGATLICQ
jgi:hypothetical protein